MERNLVKESINLQMERFIKAASTTIKAMVLEKSPTQTMKVMKGNGS